MTRLTRRAVLASAAGAACRGAAAASAEAGGAWTPVELGERVWLEWRADDLPDGPVERWTDRAGNVAAAQADAALQPRKGADGVSFTRGTRLDLPLQGRGYLVHRAVVLLFRIDEAAAGQTSGSLLVFNGTDSGQGARQPALLYRGTGSGLALQAEWRDAAGPNAASFDLQRGEGWHCLVSRRVGGRHHASLDGQAEQVIGRDICLARSAADARGLIGDFRDNGPAWTVDTILVLQDELGDADAERLAAWALWKRGAQSRLPPQHPYRSQPPRAEAATRDQARPETTAAQWAVLQRYWDKDNPGREIQQAYLSPPDLTGYVQVFEDHFTSMTVGDEVTGKGPWWSPVHGAATGKARTARVADRPPVFTQSGSELTIRMQRTPRGWQSGVFTSVNLNGHGNAWNGGYFEFKARASRGNGFAAWPAFWVKSINEFFRLTESRLEVDLYEGYNSDPKGHHQAMHTWPAARVQPGRIVKHRGVGNYTGLKAPTWGERNVDLFDDEYHLYGLMVDDTWLRFYFDNRELARAPAPAESKQPLFILVDLALLPTQADKADGDYTLTLDYIRVLQRPAGPGSAPTPR